MSLRSLGSLSLVPVLLWIAMQFMMLTPSAATPSANQTQKHFVDNDFIEIVICTPNGFKKILIGPDGEIQEESETYPDCRWCQMFQNAAVVAADRSNVQRVDFNFILKPYERFTQSTHGSLQRQPFQSRAPPYLI